MSRVTSFGFRALVAAALFCASGGVAYVLLWPDPEPVTREALDGRPPAAIPQGQPCAEAQELSSESFLAAADLRELPQVAAAQAPPKLQMCGLDGIPVMTINGIWVFVESGYPVKGRSEWLAALAEQRGGTVSIVDGVEMYQSPDAWGPVRQQVLVMIPGQDSILRIQAPSSVPIDRLMALARALDASKWPHQVS